MRYLSIKFVFIIDKIKFYLACLLLVVNFSVYSAEVNKDINKESRQTATNKTDSEILESLDSLDVQVSEGVLVIKSKDDMKNNDHFDNLVVESALNQEQINENSKNESDNEESIINKLDNSDLMDFEEESDLWWSDTIEDVEIEDID